VAWPQPTDYNEAIQNPRLCFRDAQLREAHVVENALGMPRPYSGNFADVYQVRSAEGEAWAVKCFTREVGHLQERYQAISDHLRQSSPPFIVSFQFLPEGMLVKGSWYPILKMDWVEGYTLNEFVRKYVHQPKVMYQLAQMWVKLSLQLRRASVCHADLQHGNVLLVPGSRTSQLALRLIDYDGMYVPALAQSPSGEIGHPNYQHPQRLRDGLYNSEVDRFPHLIIYTALRALTVGGRDLWDRYDNSENLLFREQDFTRPTESPLILDLWQLPDPDIRRLVGHVLLGSLMPLDRVAMLDEVVGSEGRPLKLTSAQERQLLDLLPPRVARLQARPASVSHFSLEELVAGAEDAPLETADEAAAVAVATAAQAAVAAAPPSEAPPRKSSSVRLPTVKPVTVLERSVIGGALLLPRFQGACRRCGDKKHFLEPYCPHCLGSDFRAAAIALVLGVAGLVLAFDGLPLSEATFQGFVGAFGAVVGVICLPLGVGLLVNALVWHEQLHADVPEGLRWPAGEEVCPRCGKVNIMPLAICRLCGCMNWGRLAGACTLAVTTVSLVLISHAHADSAGWWDALLTVGRWLCRIVGVLASLTILLGAFEAVKLQSRLPRKGRVRSSLGQLVLVGAVLLPAICAMVLVAGLFWRPTPPREPSPPWPGYRPPETKPPETSHTGTSKDTAPK
jgi:hypothetical protein